MKRRRGSFFRWPAPQRARQYEIAILLLPASLLWGMGLIVTLGAGLSRFGLLDPGSWSLLLIFCLTALSWVAIWQLATRRHRYASMGDVPLWLRLGVWLFRGVASVIALLLLVMVLMDVRLKDPAQLLVGLVPLFALILAIGPEGWPISWLAVCRRWIWWGLLAITLTLAAASMAEGESLFVNVFSILFAGSLVLGPLALLAIDLAMIELRSLEPPFEPPVAEWLPDGTMHAMPIPADAFKVGEQVRCTDDSDRPSLRGDLAEDWRRLTRGAVYTVRAVNVQRFHTCLRLNEVAGTFSSVRFERVGGVEPEA
ncbi:hypothetical protein [Ferriphaselus sp. R-1]|uniref:hypothetical protein n=1 Tax=Ferriphaselus sp. R-1 TaxID=1485544 RepID=UPI00126984B0|nr:hypothetical protein [Ferriphaselus sp. R-1]